MSNIEKKLNKQAEQLKQKDVKVFTPQTQAPQQLKKGEKTTTIKNPSTPTTNNNNPI